MGDPDAGKQNVERWRELAAAELRGADPDSLVWQTPEGIAVQPLFTAADLEGLETVGGIPGAEPFVRGPRATMYANRPWTIRQYAGFGSAEETNVRFRYLLERGQTGLSVAFDMPTVTPYDVASAVYSLDRLASSTGDDSWSTLAVDARAWFDGRNKAGLPVYDRERGRVADGLDEDRINVNSGAEANIVAAEALFGAAVASAEAMQGLGD
jgi:methylmalonyl-CoA mutase N-terminal domain/subunit